MATRYFMTTRRRIGRAGEIGLREGGTAGRSA
jgi:hypothetical protein